MEQLIQKNNLQNPTLNTVIMVEKVLQDMEESVIKISELKKILPRQVNHITLMLILQYLEYSNKIAVGLKGITWIHNTNENLRKAISEGMEL
jgi:exosome complex RNA-binding protein Rrp4